MPAATPFKERRDEHRVYFLTGPGSQWYPGYFVQSLRPGGAEYPFTGREQYQMACKADAFEDHEALERILRCVPRDRNDPDWDNRPLDHVLSTVEGSMAMVSARMAKDPLGTLKAFSKFPRVQKEIGREVRGFDDPTWISMREEVVFSGSVALAAQNPEFRTWLLDAGERDFVEGSGKDKIWGVGIWWNDDRILDPANWNGLNLLGKINGMTRDWCVKNHGFLDPLPGYGA